MVLPREVLFREMAEAGSEYPTQVLQGGGKQVSHCRRGLDVFTPKNPKKSYIGGERATD